MLLTQSFMFVTLSYVVLTLMNVWPVISMTRQQLKNSGKLVKKTCMPKNDVTEVTYINCKVAIIDQVGEIEQGKFLEERNIMCYVACVYAAGGVMKNNKINLDAMVKQVDMLFPAEMKEPVKKTIQLCRGVAKNYNDICEASYWTAKCMYDADPANFVFA